MNGKKVLAPAALALTLSLGGCVSEEEMAAAHAVITALPEEIAGCYFIDDVDTGVRGSMWAARLELKRQTALRHGTHVVERFVVQGELMPRYIGVALSGRAYRCPEGKGPLREKPEALTLEMPYIIQPSASEDDHSIFAF